MVVLVAQVTSPTPMTRRDGAYIHLGRHPDTEAAWACTDATLTAILPHLASGRPIGRKGHSPLRQDLGRILAGIMRPGLQGEAVRAQASPSGSMWKGSPIGRDRFWRVVNALRAAGLVEMQAGVSTPPQGFHTGYGGLATAMWPTPAMVGLAASCGVVEATRQTDWRNDASERAVAKNIDDPGLLTCRPYEGVPSGMTPTMEDKLAALRAELREINVANAGAAILGAGHTAVLVRRFLHSLDFAGRFYAPITNMPDKDRLRATFNGEAVVEVDVKASQLTLLLGIVGHSEPPRDAYAFDALPRQVVKDWVTQCLGAGKPPVQWSKRVPGRPPPMLVWDALRPCYPFLSDLPALVPIDALSTLPKEMHGWGAGQWIVQREASIIATAMLAMVRAGVPVLSVHDSLVVPASAEERAKRALSDAFESLAGITPRLEVQRPPGVIQ